MRSRGAYRLRVGQYRVIYEINDLQVRITGLVLKFGVPGIGEAEDTQTDLARVQMFVRVVNGLVDELAGYRMRDEDMFYLSYDDVVRETGETGESGEPGTDPV